MWFKKRLESVENLVESEELDNLCECERCGCLLRKGHAIRGKSVIEDVVTYIRLHGERIPIGIHEVIREVYYCKVHKPKGK